MVTTVARWRCKCGASIKVLAETLRERPAEELTVACPSCGEKQIIDAHKILKVETSNDGLFNI
jgi:hypothetical protein